MIDENNIINVGDYLIIQRAEYMKLHKLKLNGTVLLGKIQVELDNVIGKPYYSTFRMIMKPRNNRVYTVEKVDGYISGIQDVCIDKSGTDNRNINDDGRSQMLSTEEILKLREEEMSSTDIVGKLITNSTTFNDKTEYSQKKYLKKKERKYFEYIQILKPSVRLLADIYYSLDPGKILGLRIDDISQILSYGNVQDNSKILMYDSGTCGLFMSAVMQRIGRNTSGLLVHMFPGSICQKEAYTALKFSSEQNERCINVCLYSVLRCFYQNYTSKKLCNEESNEKKSEEICSANSQQKSDNENCQEGDETRGVNATKDNSSNIEGTSKNEDNKTKGEKRKCSDESDVPAKRPCWQIENERACKVLEEKVDSLIVVAKEHPSTIVEELLSFLNDGGSIVVFSLLRECLENLYFDLKHRKDIISLRLTNTMMRNYQVLPDRTHPEVQMTCGGYLLTGFKIGL